MSETIFFANYPKLSMNPRTFLEEVKLVSW